MKNIVNAWLSKQPNENQAVLRTLLDDHLFKGILLSFIDFDGSDDNCILHVLFFSVIHC